VGEIQKEGDLGKVYLGGKSRVKLNIIAREGGVGSQGRGGEEVEKKRYGLHSKLSTPY